MIGYRICNLCMYIQDYYSHIGRDLFVFHVPRIFVFCDDAQKRIKEKI